MKDVVSDDPRVESAQTSSPSHNLVTYCAGSHVKKGAFRQLYTSRYYLNKGIVLHWLGQREKAISSFRTALSLDWRHENAALWLSRAERT